MKNNSIFGSIHAEEDFLSILEHERLRTLRSGVPFSLLFFKTAEGSEEIKIFEDLIKVIILRVRATDEIGWYRDFQIVVFLPDTRFDGAKMLADDILRKNARFKDVICEIQIFPDDTKADSRSGEQDLAFYNSKSSGKETGLENHITLNCCEFEESIVLAMPAWKRCLDILGAGTGLILTVPIFLFVAAFIKLVSPGPILFKQERVGFRKKPFVCLKFRTMKVEADKVVHEQYLSELIKDENKTMVKLDEKDPRIIPFGKILRKTGLDELPQLINILLGDMSLVGPRPCTPCEASEYRIWQQRRFDTKPGLTGLWQVSGKNKTTFVEMMRLDIGYSISKSLLIDIWILIKTFPTVFAQVFDRFPKR